MALVPFVARVMVDTFVAIGAVAMSRRYSNSASAIPDGAVKTGYSWQRSSGS
jgi:hypothetical protein